MIVGRFRPQDAKPKSMLFPEQSPSGVDPKRRADVAIDFHADPPAVTGG
jgi:hypothetical protein